MKYTMKYLNKFRNLYLMEMFNVLNNFWMLDALVNKRTDFRKG